LENTGGFAQRTEALKEKAQKGLLFSEKRSGTHVGAGIKGYVSRGRKNTRGTGNLGRKAFRTKARAEGL